MYLVHTTLCNSNATYIRGCSVWRSKKVVGVQVYRICSCISVQNGLKIVEVAVSVGDSNVNYWKWILENVEKTQWFGDGKCAHIQHTTVCVKRQLTVCAIHTGAALP